MATLGQLIPSRRQLFGVGIFIILQLILAALFWFMIHALRQQDHEGHAIFCLLFFCLLGATVLAYLNCKQYLRTMRKVHGTIISVTIFILHILVLIEWIREIYSGNYWSWFSNASLIYFACIIIINTAIWIYRCARGGNSYNVSNDLEMPVRSNKSHNSEEEENLNQIAIEP